jgi:hypothetical protein
MRFEMRTVKAILAVALCGVALAGCSSLRNMAGLQKKSPDEFAVTTKAPLVIPPDFNLRPPMPGAPPTNQLDPSSNAEQALFSGTSDPQTVAAGMRGNYTPAEKLLLANAGIQKADPGVRVKLTADQRTVQNANRSFTDKVLGASATPDNGKPVNGDAEVTKRNSGNRPVTKQKEESGGWFDWF